MLYAILNIEVLDIHQIQSCSKLDLIVFVRLLPTKQNEITLNHVRHAPRISKPSHSRLGSHNRAHHVVIGVILSNGSVRNDKYRCHEPLCSGATFNRLADLKRHHSTRHAEARPEYWCPIDGCPRSLNGGEEAFSRRDKMKDHLRRVHGQEE